MLGKLVKYEIKASGRILFPICLATVALAVVSGILYKIPQEIENTAWILEFMGQIILVLFGVLLVTSGLIATIVSIYRFKTNLFDAEGYLMHTLPVKTHTHITAKLIASGICEVLVILSALLSGMIYLLFTAYFTSLDIAEIFRDIGAMISKYPAPAITYTVEVLLLGIAYLVAKNIMLYAAISVGHMANTKKVFKSVWAYIGFSFAQSMIFGNITSVVLRLIPRYWTYGINGVHVFLIVGILINGIAIAVFYIITNYCMKYRLNLQ